MISPNEPLSINPAQLSEDERKALSASLRNLSGATPWEDLIFRRTEAQLLDLAMEQVRFRRQAARNAAIREELTAHLSQLKAEKQALFARISEAVARHR